MSVSVLQGKVARLPMIYAMRGMDESLVSYSESDPFRWFLKDAESFFRHYAEYRSVLIAFIRDHPPRLGTLLHQLGYDTSKPRVPVPPGTSLEQLLDLIHATFLGRTLDLGVVNHETQMRLGDPKEPIVFAPQWPGWAEPEKGDVVHKGNQGGRRYVWRRAVLDAEPADEIEISAEEMACVERQLDAYHLKRSGAASALALPRSGS